MPLWDEFATLSRGIARDVDLVAGQVRENELLLDEIGRFGDQNLPPILRSQAIPALGIYGFGAWIEDYSGEVVRAAFLHPVAAGLSQSLLRTRVGGILAQYIDINVSLLAQFRAVALTPPEALGGLAESGSALTVDGVRGTLGAATQCSEEGVRGFATAGHVAASVGSAVFTEDGQTLGTVMRTSPRPDERGGPDPVADVALIQSDHARDLLPPAVRAARLGDRVLVQANGGYRRTYVRGVLPAILIRPDLAPWGEVAITAEAISRHGDSGAPAYLDWAGGPLLGHVVGGAPNDYSVIQDVSYQYAALGLE